MLREQKNSLNVENSMLQVYESIQSIRTQRIIRRSSSTGRKENELEWNCFEHHTIAFSSDRYCRLVPIITANCQQHCSNVLKAEEA